MAKVGRNEPCPCGSGKKFKRCHGSIEHLERTDRVLADVGKTRGRMQAAQVQRQRQQGLGRPIISAESNGYRLVAVKNRLHYSKNWKTFHDFLINYLKSVMGRDWGNAEIAKPAELRHPIVIWYQLLCEQQRLSIKEPGKVATGKMTGAIASYMHLAYDLYALDHNAELQAKLVARLRNHDNFTGARYEVYVAATFIRAGFDLEFENEDDGTITHCEFTATYRRTGKKFSVEAKRREGARPRIGHLFNNALSKHANHTRVIFIDINMRDDATDNSKPVFLEKALRRLRELEGTLLNAQPRPPAYVFVTNTPWSLYLEAPAPRCAALYEGFQIPDFKGGTLSPSLRHAIDAREAHIEMHELAESIRDHSSIPSTFDGDIPELAFAPNARRLLIGERYMVPDASGSELQAELESATVNENEQSAMCIMKLDNDQRIIVHMPLSDIEMDAWRRHPDTFFGVVGQRHTRVENLMELYDFFHRSYKKSTKEQLVSLLAGSSDLEQLKELDQSKLASVYAERTANAAWAVQERDRAAAEAAGSASESVDK